MHIADIDYQALSKNSWLHQRRTDVKLLSGLLMLIAVLVAQSLTTLVVILCVLVLAMVIAKLSIKTILHLSFYPLFFSSLFVSLIWSQNPTLGMLSILKGVASAYIMISIVSSTPYIDIFASMGKVMPAIIVDLFLFTYRSFFILLEKVSDLIRIIRLRGGFHPFKLIRNIKNIASALALLFIRAFEMNDRMYNIYNLRGYTGKLPLRESTKPFTIADGICLMITAGMLIGALL